MMFSNFMEYFENCFDFVFNKLNLNIKIGDISMNLYKF